MRIKLILLTCIVAFTADLIAQNPDKDVYELISSRIRADVQQGLEMTDIEKSVNEGSGMYNGDGSFVDIDYQATDMTNWPPLEHIERLYRLSFAYTMPDSKYYEDQNVYEMIENGLSYWFDSNPKSENWWFNQIAEPQCIGIILLQMQTGKNKLPDDLIRKTLRRMCVDGGTPLRRTGPNKTDIALHWLYRACITKDRELLSMTMEQAFEPLAYTTGEGIQHDNSYFQHGSQLYIIGYGDELIKGIIGFALYSVGTEFQLDKERLDIFDKFIRETYLKVIRGQYCHFNVMGRGMSRINGTDKNAVVRFCKSMTLLVPERAAEYHEAIARLSALQPASYNVTPSSTVYSEGDYALHIRARYSFGVRAVSARTIRNEYGNGENLATYFVSDGSTHIAVNGDEYFNIFPVWDWSRIPGVTAPAMGSIPKAEVEWETFGTSTFTGGVSDSLFSTFTSVYEDNYAGINTSAKKSWFFFDDEIVCLGSGINSSSTFPVHTTINQCLLQTDIVVSEGGKEKKTGRKKYAPEDNLKWVLHGGVGYIFPEGGVVAISGEEQKGSWRTINEAQKDIIEKKKVFTLWLDHGLQPEQESYAYIVVPDMQTPKDMRRHDIDNIKILANNDSVQVVQNRKSDMWQMVFFEPTSFSYQGTTVKVDAPCAIIIKGTNSNPMIHIADPERKQAIIHVEITTQSGRSDNIVCDFTNTGVFAGKSQSYLMK